ncbi:MAG: site-specific tyrosine recombinase XerD [Flavobacteriales bacterium]|nr:site-specific tyrosine recombinase XerD [Flavobacteriales bacterium]
MIWQIEIRGFENHLKLERGLSPNTLTAYRMDVQKLADFIEEEAGGVSPQKVVLEHLKQFISSLQPQGISSRSQSRIISGIKAFFKYLLLEKLISEDPSELLEAPKIGMKLPVTLSIEEVDLIMATIDLSRPQATRDRAMLEVLYGCGLRVSELCELLVSNLHLKEGFVKVIGKGDKERLAPIGGQAVKHLKLYLENDRVHRDLKRGFEDHVFLNHHGRKISRVSVFNIIKKLCEQAGIRKNVSPHTFRHSFATHLVQGGADLRAVQEMLGHESITTTEIYSHLDREYLRSAIIDFHPLERGGDD